MFLYLKNCPAEELEPFVQIAQTRFYKHKMYVFMQDDQLDRVFLSIVERLKFIEQISPVKNKSFPSLNQAKCSRTQDFLDMGNSLLMQK